MIKKNPFKEILTDKSVPPEIKKKIMSELASINLVTEVADLFTVKLASIFEELFISKKNKK